MINGRYILNPNLEKLVDKIHEEIFIIAQNAGKNIILDNTHAKAKYIISAIDKHKECVYTLRFFTAPLWKLKLRNIIRYFKTGVWIPTKVIENMDKNILDLGVNLAQLLAKQIPNITKVER